MRTGFPFFSRFLSKLVEIIGAGLASAAGAFLLGHIATPSTPPAVVQIVPADAETIRMVRGDQTAVDELRKDLAGADQPAPETAPVSATVSVNVEKVEKEKVEKIAKTPPLTTPLPPARREHKPQPAHQQVARSLSGGEPPVRVVPASHAAEQSTVVQVGEAENLLPAPAPVQSASEGGFRLFAALRQIPAWLLPNTDHLRSDVPRPPLPVGQFWQSTM